jgi:methionyl-tRNA formyltransferase
VLWPPAGARPDASFKVNVKTRIQKIDGKVESGHRIWDESVSGAPKCDIYYRPGYACATATVEQTEPFALLIETGQSKFLMPALLRTVSGDGSGPGWVDAATPYGYGGMLPLTPTSGSREDTREAILALLDWCKEERIVSYFLRTHPLLRRDSAELEFVEWDEQRVFAHASSKTLAIDLQNWDDSPDLPTGMRKGRISDLHHAQKNLSVSWSQLSEAQSQSIFRDIYDESMRRLNAEQFHRFPTDYYTKLAALGDKVEVAIAWSSVAPVGVGMFLFDRKYAHYHLSGALSEGRKHKAATLILTSAARRARSRGCEFMHLGGGMECNDSLLAFKASFGGISLQYKSATLAPDGVIYNAIASRSKIWPYSLKRVSPGSGSSAERSDIRELSPARGKRLKIIYMGKDKASAAECLRYLVTQGAEVAVVVGPNKASEVSGGERLVEVARSLGIPTATDAELYEQLSGGPKRFDLTDVDLVISYLFWRRIRKPLIELPKIGCINFHPAPLPEFQGLWGYNAAIYERLTEWGVTAHFVAETFDTGDIIQERRFPIRSEKETAYTLEGQSMTEMVTLFKDVMSSVKTSRTLPRKPQGTGRYISHAAFNEVRRIAPTDTAKDIERKVRAFWFPPLNGAYLEIGGKEYTVVSEELLRGEILSRYNGHRNPKKPEVRQKIKAVGIGGGGHSRVILESLRCAGEYEVVGLLDDDPKLQGTTIEGLPVLGTLAHLPVLLGNGIQHAFIGVGGVGSNEVRAKLFKRAQTLGFTMIRAVHPSAVVASTATIGEGSVVMAGAIVNPGARVGMDVVVNTGAIIDHDCSIGDHVHIAPGVTLSGNVRVGAYSHLGTGAVARQGITIGSNTVVGAGAAVVQDLPDNVTAVGVPAKIISARAKSASE